MTETKSRNKTPVINFTVKEIDAIAVPKRGAPRLEFKDSKVAGLYLRVTPGGVKTFSFVGRPKGATKSERETIGRYPAVRPEEARALAMQMAGSIAGGKSVAAARQAKKGEMTVDELWDLYAEYAKAHDKKLDTFENAWNSFVRPKWGSKRLSDIKSLAVERWHLELPGQIMEARAQKAAALVALHQARRREVAQRQAVRRHGPDPKRPIPGSVDTDKKNKFTGRTAANRALELLRAMYNFARHEKRQYFVGANPASGHKLYEVDARERFLQPDELRPFFAALAAEPNETFRDFFCVALLTGVRRAAVLAMKWDDVSLFRAEWAIDKSMMKNKKAQTVTLAPEAVQILEQRYQKRNGSAYVFPSDRTEAARAGEDDHIKEPHSAWTRILERAELKDLHIHDLRRTLGSWQARTGSSLILIGKSLNHMDPQSTAIYAKLDLDPVRQSVDRATSAMFEAAGVKPTADVIPFPTPKPQDDAMSNRKAIGK